MPDANSEHLHGVFPALPTPLKPGGEIDVQGLEKLVDHVLRGGVHGLWVLGSTSEFPALPPSERKLVVEVTLSRAESQIPVIVGVIDNDLRNIIANAEAAKSAGAFACFITLPFYFIVDQQEAIRFVREIAAAAPLPVILYDNSPSTGIKLTAETLLKMAECPNLIALKDSTCDFVRFQNVLAATKPKPSFGILQGIDQLIVPSLMMGASGAVAALASIAPSLFVKLYEAAKANNFPKLISLQPQVLQLCKLYAIGGEWTDGAFFMGMKAALEVLGISGRGVSKPFVAMPEEKMKDVEQLLQAYSVAPTA